MANNYKLKKDAIIFDEPLDTYLSDRSKKALVVLANLVQEPGEVTESDVTPGMIAKAAQIEPSSIAGVLVPLYRYGLIERAKAGVKSFLQLSTEGWEVVERKGGE
jgi:DNA-binding MarR family transcriptional regulator